MLFEGSGGYGGNQGGYGNRGGQNRNGGSGFRGHGRRGPFQPKPVKEGDEFNVTIEAVGSKGDGIGKVEGFVVFIPGVQTGETVRIKIKEVRGKSAVGEKIE